MKRKEFIKTTGFLGAGLTVFGGAAGNAIERIQKSGKKKKINPLSTQNTIVILLGGGIRWEQESSTVQTSIIQGYTRAAMPNLFQPSNVALRDLELLLKQPLNQKIIDIPFEKSGKFIPRITDTNQHQEAVAKLLGLNMHSTQKDAGNFEVSSQSAFYQRWIQDAKKNDKFYYHHDLAGNSRKIIGSDELIDIRLNQHLIQHATSQKTTGEFINSDPLPMFKEALNYLKEFKPKVSILHPRLVDVAHSDFRQSLINMNRLDYSVAWLYSQLQAVNPSFAVNTNWIILSEHGRDYKNNGRLDKSKLPGFDHKTEDAKNCFMVLVGPKIKAATTLRELNPFSTRMEMSEIVVGNTEIFHTIAALTK